MSGEQIREGLREMVDSGRIDPKTAREAERNPLHAETLVRVDKLERETSHQSSLLTRMGISLFGDKDLGIAGLVTDVKELNGTIARAGWAIGGGIATAGVFGSLIGLWISYKH